MEKDNILEKNEEIKDVTPTKSNSKESQLSESTDSLIESSKKATNKKTQTSGEKEMDALTKIREEEKAKLEALREKEQEKTRIAVERERARLEAELAKEINDLETQLERAKNASQKVKSKSPRKTEKETDRTITLVDSAAIDDEVKTIAVKPVISDAEDAIEVNAVIADKNTEDLSKVTVAEKATKKTSTTTKKASTATKAKTKTAAEKAKEKEKAAAAKAKEKEKAKAAAEKAKEKEKAKAASEKKAAEEAAKKEKAKQAAEKAAAELAAKQAAEKEAAELAAREAAEKEAAELAAREAAEKAAAELAAKEAAKKEAAELAAKEVEKQIIEPDVKEEKPAVEQSKEEVIEVPVVVNKEPVKLESTNETSDKVEPIAIKDSRTLDDAVKTTIPTAIDEVQKSVIPQNLDSTSMKQPYENSRTDASSTFNSLQKLRAKIAAQKQLEKELMEREVSRVQEKDRSLQDKFSSLSKLIEEEETLVTIEDLENEKRFVEELKADKAELEHHIDNLNDIIEKVLNIRVSGIPVINPENYELTKEFLELEINSGALNSTILEIEEELDSLTQSHESNIRKLIEAENSYRELEKLYNKQEEVINDLNKQVTQLRDQVAKEKILNKEYSTKLEQLKNEKARIERTVMHLRPILPVDEIQDEEKPGIINDLDRLSLEIKKLLANDELSKTKEELRSKEVEIENLKLQLEAQSNKAIQEMPTPQDGFWPYYASPASMFIPRNYNYGPQPMMPKEFDIESILQEMRKIQEDINQLKSKPSSDEIPKIENAQANVLKESEITPQPASENQKSEITEVEANPVQIQLPIEEQPVDMNLKKITELEQQIKEKDLLIENMKEEFKRLSEEDILDPNFKRKIRVIRDKKSELIKRSSDEEQLYNEAVKNINQKIDFTKVEIDGINDKIFEMDMNFKQNRDFSSTTKDAYEKAKGKSYVQLQLVEEKLHELEEDLSRANQKYQAFLETKNQELAKLDMEEIETIDFYLNKLRQDSKLNIQLKSTEEEKKNLIDKLGQLKSNGNNDYLKPEDNNLSFNNDLLDEKVEDVEELKQHIRQLTAEYNQYYQQLSDLKVELDKRIEYEKHLRAVDQDIYDFCSSRNNLDECLKEYQSKSELIEKRQNALADGVLEGEGRTEQLKVKAEIQDLMVHRDDLRAKIDFYRRQIIDLESRENVKRYNAVISQIEKIRVVQRELRDKAEAIKLEVQTKTKQLENNNIERARMI